MEKQIIVIQEDTVYYVRYSGYKHAPIFITWINGYEQCGVDIMDLEKVRLSYNKEVYKKSKELINERYNKADTKRI